MANYIAAALNSANTKITDYRLQIRPVQSVSVTVGINTPNERVISDVVFHRMPDVFLRPLVWTTMTCVCVFVCVRARVHAWYICG